MTKEFYKEFADYNCWANDKVCNWLLHITDAQWQQGVVSSFNSIQQTVLHVAGAENVWAERMNRTANPVWLPAIFKGSKDEHISLWKKTSHALKKFVFEMDENILTTKLDFKRLNGDAFSMPYYQVLGQVLNHSTYHRGQLVTMLRQVGFTNVEGTDMMLYYRK